MSIIQGILGTQTSYSCSVQHTDLHSVTWSQNIMAVWIPLLLPAAVCLLSCDAMVKNLAVICSCSVLECFLVVLCSCSVLEWFLAVLCGCSVLECFLAVLCSCSVLECRQWTPLLRLSFKIMLKQTLKVSLFISWVGAHIFFGDYICKKLAMLRRKPQESTPDYDHKHEWSRVPIV